MTFFTWRITQKLHFLKTISKVKPLGLFSSKILLDLYTGTRATTWWGNDKVERTIQIQKPVIPENLENKEFWSGWLAKVKLDIYATLRFTHMKERICKKQYYWSYSTVFTKTISTVVCPHLEYCWKIKTEFMGLTRENLPSKLKKRSKNLQRGEKTFLWKREMILL